MKRRRKLPLGSLFVTVISLFVFVIPMIRGFISNQEKYQNFVEVDAIITNITKSNTDKTKLMEYQYKHDGKKYTAERNELFTHGKKIGDTVTIKCNPKNPSEIQDGSDTFFLFMIFIFSFPIFSLIIRFLNNPTRLTSDGDSTGWRP